MRVENLPDPGERFTLERQIGGGVHSRVFRALDNDSGGRPVAIKIQKYEADLKECISEEYRVLRDFCKHPNLPELLGVYCKPKSDGADEIWFVMEFCEGGSAIDLIRSLSVANRRLTETHIAFILREVAKALCFLHKNHVIHRDVRGSNILLTRTGDVKLIDFGMTKDTHTTYGKRSTCIGSPNWMAPEIITAVSAKSSEVYNNRSDVWAMGITAIELADGKPPFADMHPSRIIFQVVRNPPPTLYRQSNWTQTFNDFIAECLEKNAECRPVVEELMEHPFFGELPENDYHLTQEIKMYVEEFAVGKEPPKNPTIDFAIYRGMLKNYDQKPRRMVAEDLATLEKLTEDTVLEEIEQRVRRGHSYNFVGDVLLAINANETTIDTPSVHAKYKFKSRSDNSPHIFAVADSAYQDMLHHEESQHILLGGESYSGKTHNVKLLMKHLQYLGEGYPAVADRINAAYSIIQAFTHAGTPTNPNSTRCVLNTQMAFASTGKLTGAIFWVYMLEKTRVTLDISDQSNFHVFYYFYDAMEQEERLKDFSFDYGRGQASLRVHDQPKSKMAYVRDYPEDNVRKFKEMEQNLTMLDFSHDQIDTIYRIMAAIIILGEIQFKPSETSPKATDIENPEYAAAVAKLLKLDEKKFMWALVNYCVINQGRPEKRKQSPGEARESRDNLANTIYCRLVDYVVNMINSKLALSRAIYGDLYTIDIMDMFGFECFSRNRFEQLMVNSLNEQLQYQYNQRIFVYEMIEQEEENIPVVQLHFYDNKLAVDHLLSKPNGLFSSIDEATKGRHNESYIIDWVNTMKSPYIKRSGSVSQFAVAHFTGSVTYDARDFSEKNRDFLPPEMVETMRTSNDPILKIMFTNLLSKTGNLTMDTDSEVKIPVDGEKKKQSKWGAALVAEKTKTRKTNSLSKGQYSQTHKMRTLSTVYRATCLELLKSLSIGANSGGTHFVRCIRSDLDNKPKGFNEDLVRQQIRAMAILDTARARSRGFPYRIPFSEFLRRYKFLAFEFDENVEVSKDNCRLLLVRLKMEGWVIGKSKVFLKYYNVEFLARLYELQVKKIIKVQSMMRAFLAKKSIANRLKSLKRGGSEKEKKKKLVSQQSRDSQMSEDEAAIRIQSAYRGHMSRKKYGPLVNDKSGKIDIQTAIFINPFARKWKAKTIFGVLLQYRAARYQDLVNFCQQVHFFNQRIVQGMTLTSHSVLLDRVNPREFQKEMLGVIRPTVLKIPFRYDLLPFFNTTYMCDPMQGEPYERYDEEDEEVWDAPLRRRKTTSADIARSAYFNGAQQSYGFDDESLVNEPFVRTPGSIVRRIAPRRFSEQNAPYPGASTSQRNSYVPSNSYSPTVYSKSPINTMRGRFDDDGMNGGYKKRAAPPPPRPNQGYQKYPAPQPRAWEPKARPDYMYEPPKVDPIKELQAIGRAQSEEAEDNPPFNFQGMLRKTNHKRNSMKRVTDGSLSVAEGNNNIVFNSRTPERPRSAQRTTYRDPGPSSSSDMNANKSFAQGLVFEEEGISEDL